MSAEMSSMQDEFSCSEPLKLKLSHRLSSSLICPVLTNPFAADEAISPSFSVSASESFFSPSRQYTPRAVIIIRIKTLIKSLFILFFLSYEVYYAVFVGGTDIDIIGGELPFFKLSEQCLPVKACTF